MKRLFFVLLISVFALNVNATGVIVLEGHYQGKNLYVQNPFAGSGVGFCTFEVCSQKRIPKTFALFLLRIQTPKDPPQFSGSFGNLHIKNC